MKKTHGHQADFTDAQNKALRVALCDHQKAKELSQDAVGQLLGVSQQVAGRMLNGRQGFGYRSGTNLARTLGYPGVDAFFRAKKVVTPSEPPQAKSA